MSVIIRDVTMPTTCQQCPCFGVSYLRDDANHMFDIVVQQCRAHRQIIRMAYSVTDTDESWHKTKRPEWCPMVCIPDCAVKSEMKMDASGVAVSAEQCGTKDIDWCAKR